MTSTNSKNVGYNVVGKFRESKEISKYQIEDINGSKAAVNKKQLCFLIGAGLINNCSVTFLKQGPVFRGNGIDLRELPEYSLNNSITEKKYKITCELVKDFRIIGFEMVDSDNIPKRYKLSDAIKLMSMNKVIGVKYENGMILSTSGNIHESRVIDMSTNKVIGRTNLNVNKFDLAKQMQFKENISALGRIELATDGLGSEMLDDRKLRSNIKTHRLDGYRIVNIVGDVIRLANEQGIIDIIVEGKDVSKLKRPEILKIIAIAILKYDKDSNIVAIQINDTNNQRLATYNYKE